MENIVYRKALEKDCHDIIVVIKRVFDEFIAPDYSILGVESFYNVVNETSLLERLKTSNQCHIACIHEEIVGVIELRDENHIRLLFVDKKYQKKGIASNLFQRAFEDYMGEITVNSSPYAVGIYERLGFEKISGELIKNGITYIPMICENRGSRKDIGK